MTLTHLNQIFKSKHFFTIYLIFKIILYKQDRSRLVFTIYFLLIIHLIINQSVFSKNYIKKDA